MDYPPNSKLQTTNIAPENGWLEHYFQGPLLLVSGRVNLTIILFAESFHRDANRGKTNIFTYPSIDEEGNLSPCKLPEGNEQKLYEYLESIGPVFFLFRWSDFLEQSLTGQYFFGMEKKLNARIMKWGEIKDYPP